MSPRSIALSACLIACAVLVWMLSPYLLDQIGLSVFDPLDRICLIFLLLSLIEPICARITLKPSAASFPP